MTDYISREEVLKKIDNIPDWDSKELLYGWIYSIPILPSHDPKSEIKEVIEKKIEYYKNRPKYIYWSKAWAMALQELLSDLFPNN